jgi:hypothetical protein
MKILNKKDISIIKQYLSSSTFKERMTSYAPGVTMSKDKFLIFIEQQLEQGQITKDRYDYLVDYVGKMKSEPETIQDDISE